MGRPPSPAQRAVQITFVLKGHLKNVQVAYIRVAALLARVRDEKLYRALGHATMDDYAAVRLGLQHAQLYRYLAVYDWIREFHHPWLARRPKGFIPELTDAQALMAPSPRPAPERCPAKGARAASREGARGPAHAAQVRKHADRDAGTRRRCARSCGRSGPLAGGSPAFRGVGDAPRGARRTD